MVRKSQQRKSGRRGLSGRGSSTKALRWELRGLDDWGVASKWVNGRSSQQKSDHARS